MCKSVKTLTLVAFMMAVLIVPVRADDTVTVNDLIENINRYDGTTIMIEGEVIGEVLERGAYSWINVNDGSNAIGIWLKTEQTAILSYFGDYKHLGDIVRITGTFYGNCPEHGGDVDIHSHTMHIVENGRPIQEEVDLLKIITAMLLILCMLVSVYIYYRATKKLDIEHIASIE